MHLVCRLLIRKKLMDEAYFDFGGFVYFRALESLVLQGDTTTHKKTTASQAKAAETEREKERESERVKERERERERESVS